MRGVSDMAKRLQRAGQSSGPTTTALVAERPVRGNGGAGPRGEARVCASVSASQGVATVTVARSAEPAACPTSTVARVRHA